MEEPQRIGLTKEANDYLDEILDSLNSEVEEKGLIKFDLYRLAVALGVKNGNKPSPLSSNTDNAFRVSELDIDKALFFAVEAANLQDNEEPIYRVVERLAEQGIRDFYKAYKSHSERMPWDKILAE
jgi:hypothetical protein